MSGNKSGVYLELLDQAVLGFVGLQELFPDVIQVSALVVVLEVIRRAHPVTSKSWVRSNFARREKLCDDEKSSGYSGDRTHKGKQPV